MLTSHAALAADAKEAFQRSVEADIAIAEAEQAQNPKHARDLFAYARELMPDDADVWFQSARFELGQNNQTTALAYLDKAVKLNPQHPLAPYDRAVLLYTMKKTPEAKAAFEQYRQDNPIDTRAAHYLGLIALEADDDKTAQAQFDVARKGDDRTAAFAAAYFAIVSAQLGDKNAGTYAAEALRVAPTQDLKQQLEPLALTATGGGGGGSERYLPWINLQLNVSMEYDSNAALAAANFARLNSQAIERGEEASYTAPINAARLTEDFRFVFRPVASEPITFELEADFINANHLNSRRTGADYGQDDNLARFDYFGPTATARFYSRFGVGEKLKLDFGVDGSYRGTWIGGNPSPRHLLNSGALAPFFGFSFWPRHVLYATGNFEYRDFVAEGLSPSSLRDPNNRDGFVYSGGLYYQVPFWLIDGILAAAYDREHTFGTNFRLNGVRASAALRLNWENKLVATAFASINFRFYRQAEPARDERRYETGVTVRYNPIPYFGVQVNYTYTQNDAVYAATRAAYEDLTYKRHVVGLTLIGQY